MKKKTFKSVLALMLALTVVIAGNMTVFAYDDGCVHHENEGNEESGKGLDLPSDSGSSDSGSSSSSSSGGSSSSSSSESSGGGSSYSSDSGSYDAGASYDAGSGSSGSTSSYSAPAPKVAGTETSAGKESFKALAKPAAGTYKVWHKGSEVCTFRVMCTNKQSVSCCTKIALKQRDDKKWAINFEVDDARDLTIGAPVDRTYMYDILGVSYVSINDSIIIDIEAEAKAAK